MIFYKSQGSASKMKKTLFLTTSILSLFFFLASSAKAACFVHYYSCDTSDVCCDFPTWQCSEGYCRDNQPHCGQYPYPCCSSPNPQCITGENCTNGYCLASCGVSGGRCCEVPPHSYYCQTTGEVCNSGGYCVAPTPTSPPSVPDDGGSRRDGGESEEGIDFNKIKDALVTAVPGIKSEFLPDSSPNVSGIISIILPYLFVIAGLLLLFYLIYGGFHMMIAANDEKGLAEAKGKITNALVGFMLLFVSYWLVQILGHIFGITIF